MKSLLCPLLDCKHNKYRRCAYPGGIVTMDSVEGIQFPGADDKMIRNNIRTLRCKRYESR